MDPADIRKLRDKLGLTQENFGHLIGVTFGTINRWENHVSKPSPLALEKLNNIAHAHKILVCK